MSLPKGGGNPVSSEAWRVLRNTTKAWLWQQPGKARNGASGGWHHQSVTADVGQFQPSLSLIPDGLVLGTAMMPQWRVRHRGFADMWFNQIHLCLLFISVSFWFFLFL